MPVKKYHNLADAYGFILAGSNNSSNGQSQGNMDKTIAIFIDDVNEHFSVNSNRNYTGGFSGGARVAAYTALFKRKITGVVGCAAGFPQITTNPNTSFAYFGIVGNTDFNYLEMKNLDRSLENANINHFLSIYNGKHDWPPPQIMNDAFVFFQLDAMRKHVIPQDTNLISKIKTQIDDSINASSDNMDWLALGYYLKKAVVFLSSFPDTQNYQQTYNKVVNNKKYKTKLEEALKQEKVEQKNQQSYIRALENKDKSWWIYKLQVLTTESLNSNNKAQVLMDKRLVNYLSLLSYMYATNALKTNDVAAANRYLTIYETVDPDNPEVYYLKAVRLTKLKQNEDAVAELYKCAEYGFADTGRILADKDFLLVKKSPEFNNIYNKVLQNINNNKETK